MEYGYLLTICIILVSTKLLGLITNRLQLPQVVGALLAGIIFGPLILNILKPSDLLTQLAELGVIVIMFCAGMDTSIEGLKQAGKASFVIATLGVLVPLGLGTLLMFCFNPSENILKCVFIGTVLTATSVSITVETLKEIGKLSTKVGNTILAAALIDDILGLICLTLVSSLGGDNVDVGLVLMKILLFFVFVIGIGVCANKLFGYYNDKMGNKNLHRYTIAAFAFCLFMAWAAEEMFGVADIIGAFSAGLMVATTPKGNYVSSKVSPMSYLLLTPIFFANIGINIKLPEMDVALIVFAVLLVIIGIISKLAGCGIAAKMCGFTKKQSFQIGFGMACRGEVALIVAHKGMELGLVDERYFGPIVILVIFCAVLTPIFLKKAFKGESPYEGLEESALVETFELKEQIDIVSENLLTKEAKIKNK